MSLRPSIELIHRSPITLRRSDVQQPLVWKSEQPSETPANDYRDLLRLIQARPGRSEADRSGKPYPAVSYEASSPDQKQAKDSERARGIHIRSEVSEDFPVKRREKIPPAGEGAGRGELPVKRDGQVESEIAAVDRPPLEKPPSEGLGTETQKAATEVNREKGASKPVSKASLQEPLTLPRGEKPKLVERPLTPKQTRSVDLARVSDRETGSDEPTVQLPSSDQAEKEPVRPEKIRHTGLVDRKPEGTPTKQDPRGSPSEPTQIMGSKPRLEPRTPRDKAEIEKKGKVWRQPVREKDLVPKPSTSEAIDRLEARKTTSRGIPDINLTVETVGKPPSQPMGSRRPLPITKQERTSPLVHRIVQRTPAIPKQEGMPDPEALWSKRSTRELTFVKPSATVSLGDQRVASEGGMLPDRGGTLQVEQLPDARTIQRSPVGERDETPVVARAGEEVTSQAAAETGGAKTEVDVEALAKQVYEILKRRLRVEQERARGWGGYSK